MRKRKKLLRFRPRQHLPKPSRPFADKRKRNNRKELRKQLNDE